MFANLKKSIFSQEFNFGIYYFPSEISSRKACEVFEN